MKPLVPTLSARLGNLVIKFLHTETYCSEVGYTVCIIISVRKTCTISRLAFDATTPVEMAWFTVLEKNSFSGILKVRCQSSVGVVTFSETLELLCEGESC